MRTKWAKLAQICTKEPQRFTRRCFWTTLINLINKWNTNISIDPYFCAAAFRILRPFLISWKQLKLPKTFQIVVIQFAYRIGLSLWYFSFYLLPTIFIQIMISWSENRNLMRTRSRCKLKTSPDTSTWRGVGLKLSVISKLFIDQIRFSQTRNTNMCLCS